MTTLQNKIDFALIMKVNKANPNGDPLNGNRPRVDYDGFGEITDVCLKRKIRDRLVERYQALAEGKQDGQAVFVQSDDRSIDGEPSLRERAFSKEHGIGKDAFNSKKRSLSMQRNELATTGLTLGRLASCLPFLKAKALKEFRSQSEDRLRSSLHLVSIQSPAVVLKSPKVSVEKETAQNVALIRWE